MARAAKESTKAAVSVTLRTAAAVVGGFGFTTASVGLSSVGLPLLLGMQRSEAVLLSAMIGFILYLIVLLWAFAEPRLGRVWVVLLSGSAAAFGLSHWLAPMLAVSRG